ncbi:hypothetical protein LZ32DRAFT_101867 [Colletotrichum eremochloae]|nr:hypothetical protein LZ32DRAFT_101867 [Colletotrichum eremochloae]
MCLPGHPISPKEKKKEEKKKLVGGDLSTLLLCLPPKSPTRIAYTAPPPSSPDPNNAPLPMPTQRPVPTLHRAPLHLQGISIKARGDLHLKRVAPELPTSLTRRHHALPGRSRLEDRSCHKAWGKEERGQGGIGSKRTIGKLAAVVDVVVVVGLGVWWRQSGGLCVTGSRSVGSRRLGLQRVVYEKVGPLRRPTCGGSPFRESLTAS